MEAEKQACEKRRADWINLFNDNLDSLEANLRVQPDCLTKPLCYLYDQTQDKEAGAVRWPTCDLKMLASRFGERAAHYYKAASIAMWRHYAPRLRSEGAPPNSTSYSVVIGLIGLEFEAGDVQNWASTLDSSDVDRACRFALYELNDFPSWFQTLLNIHQEVVINFLVHEMKHELIVALRPVAKKS